MEKRLFYENSNEYIIDLLKLLDLKIQRLILIENPEQLKDLNPWKGMTISEGEVSEIFNHDISEEKLKEINELNKELKKLTTEIENKILESNNKGMELNFEKLIETFQLDPIEKNILLVGISVELDAKYEKLYAFLQDNINKKRPSIDLGLRLLNLSSKEKLHFRNKIRKESFLKIFILKNDPFQRDESFFSSEIIIDEKIVDYILGNENMDIDLIDMISFYKYRPFKFESIGNDKIVENVALTIENFLSDYDQYQNNLFIYIQGDKGIGKKHEVKKYCHSIKKDLLIVDLKVLAVKEISLRKIVMKIIREGVLREATICFENFHCIEEILEDKNILLKDFLSMTTYFIEPVFILSEKTYNQNKFFNENTVVSFKLDRPDYKTREQLWEFYAKKYKVENLYYKDLAVKFHFTPLQIKNTIKGTKSKLLLHTDKEKIIYESCYKQVDNQLTQKAVKVNLGYDWNQLILPNEQKRLLMDACNQVKNRYLVYNEWGFDKKIAYGKGLAIICAGPPGTGKTMSAQVIANELNLELYRIDLSQVISKYVGETEKNLHHIFSEASLSNAILFFDEADSIFGKRSDVKSANDRYANIETSYLLQKIEEYEGITMLATNFLNNIDDAFLRRINFIIKFPFPDKETREKIWKITIPSNAPIEDLDFDFIAKTFEMSGGNIKNTIIYAAFLAAQENQKIGMKHILFAAKYELQKMDKLLLKENLGEYVYLLEEYNR
ncbi:MAG: ATP-binding protein [Marinisporobacter sp.]|jgi:SpoVK/Ycf46/Vps4 family AAA+-type ATPase|nr:ATP-binding protein [Marinisporobacter sp.]